MIADEDASDIRIPAVFLRRHCYRDLLHKATENATLPNVKITGDTLSSWFSLDSFPATWLFYTMLIYIAMSVLWAGWHVFYGPIRLPIFRDAYSIRFVAIAAPIDDDAADPASRVEHARRTLRQLTINLQNIWRRHNSWRAAEEQVRQIPMVLHSSAEAQTIEDFPTRCPVCLEDFVDDERLRLLPCRHRFHVDCVDRWLVTQRRLCPVCKQDAVTPNNETRPPRESTSATSQVHLATPPSSNITSTSESNDDQLPSPPVSNGDIQQSATVTGDPVTTRPVSESSTHLLEDNQLPANYWSL
ncbi:hypothetical protein BDF19DRAFT_272680 [Syncephalis fuscata]|nr:hypothetical protein BDF19DRAFT_272680 [Syncephalis fuscata]